MYDVIFFLFAIILDILVCTCSAWWRPPCCDVPSQKWPNQSRSDAPVFILILFLVFFYSYSSSYEATRAFVAMMRSKSLQHDQPKLGPLTQQTNKSINQQQNSLKCIQASMFEQNCMYICGNAHHTAHFTAQSTRHCATT